MSDFTHLDENGEALMVDVSDKNETVRIAKAQAIVQLTPATLQAITAGEIEKGEVLSVARVAGIMAAKKTSELIPLCHPLMLSSVKIEFEIDQTSSQIRVLSRCKIKSQTGVEMEALQAVSTAALTIYDMCKALDKGIVISDICLLSKTGGKSGDWQRA